jgi:hypothetical protein
MQANTSGTDGFFKRTLFQHHLAKSFPKKNHTYKRFLKALYSIFNTVFILKG